VPRLWIKYILCFQGRIFFYRLNRYFWCQDHKMSTNLPVTLLNKCFWTIYSFCLWIDFFLRDGRGPTLSKKKLNIFLPYETNFFNPWLVPAGTFVNSQGFEWNVMSLLARSYFSPCQPDISLLVRSYFIASQPYFILSQVWFLSLLAWFFIASQVQFLSSPAW